MTTKHIKTLTLIIFSGLLVLSGSLLPGNKTDKNWITLQTFWNNNQTNKFDYIAEKNKLQKILFFFEHVKIGKNKEKIKNFLKANTLTFQKCSSLMQNYTPSKGSKKTHNLKIFKQKISQFFSPQILKTSQIQPQENLKWKKLSPQEQAKIICLQFELLLKKKQTAPNWVESNREELKTYFESITKAKTEEDQQDAFKKFYCELFPDIKDKEFDPIFSFLDIHLEGKSLLLCSNNFSAKFKELKKRLLMKQDFAKNNELNTPPNTGQAAPTNPKKPKTGTSWKTRILMTTGGLAAFTGTAYALYNYFLKNRIKNKEYANNSLFGPIHNIVKSFKTSSSKTL